MAYEPISLLFLAYNEASTIEKEVRGFYDAIIKHLPGSEFIIAEDGSTDGTTEILQKLSHELGIKHLTSNNRKGYAKALVDAVNQAKHDFIFFSDTGLKHDPADFWKLYERRYEYDLIVGRKTNRQDQWYRRLTTYGYSFIIRNYFRIGNVYDADSGFRLFNRAVISSVFQKGLTFKNLVGSEVVLRSILGGLRYIEVPVSYAQREGPSRGLPLKKISSVVIKSIVNLYNLKQDFTQKR